MKVLASVFYGISAIVWAMSTLMWILASKPLMAISSAGLCVAQVCLAVMMLPGDEE